MKKFAAMTGLYSMSHFLVDFCCAFLIFSRLAGSGRWLVCLFTYNFCAFALQMPFGIIADKTGRNRFFAAAGCLLTALSPVFSSLPLLFCSAAGIGNALFHIGAGRDVLCGSGRNFSALGIFVSPGALGLYFGSLFGKSGVLPSYFIIIILILDAAAILAAVPKLADTEADGVSPEKSRGFWEKGVALVLAALFAVVFLRSFVGLTLSFPWKADGKNALYLVLALVCGKALGGILADRLGPVKTSFASLFLCAGLLLFYSSPVSGILAVFFFNMTMPISLGAMARLMPHRLGFGFGFLTFALFIGLIPVLMNVQNPLTIPYGYTAVSILSAILLYYGLREPEHGR